MFRTVGGVTVAQIHHVTKKDTTLGPLTASKALRYILLCNI